MKQLLKGIPTNVITGFLGAGKSTAIQGFIRQKQRSERWAVLVNEFGEVGVDGGLLAGEQPDSVVIREVPGGCMCCTAGLPMHMAMTMLLARAQPDRLLIEPSGLGHPKEVMSILTNEHYKETLSVGATLTLVDARKVSDSRYTQHESFNEQLEMGDVIVATKADLYQDNDFSALQSYLADNDLLNDRTLVQSIDGSLSLSLLSESFAPKFVGDHQELGAASDELPEQEETVFPPEGFIRRSNSVDDYASHGWLFRSDFVFDESALRELIPFGNAQRVKGLLRTNLGPRGYNYSGDAVSVLPMADASDSRIEVISDVFFPALDFEKKLLEAAARS